VGVPFAAQVTGESTALMVLALSLLTLGGALILHEPGYATRTKRFRLYAVFGCIGAVLVLLVFPPALRRRAYSPERVSTASMASGDQRASQAGQESAAAPTDP
jgi:hypothetical protein